MGLTLYNTAARRKQLFEPLTPGHVRMYVCGPTVYDYAHIGNARAIVVFDLLYRVLKRTFNVKYVRNITDVDDKIIAAAAESGEAIDDITTRTTEAFHKDMAALGCLPPDVEPRATAHVPQMIEMIETLMAKGNAYEADGHVLFSVPSMANYGALSGRNRDEQIAGARVDVAPYKRDPRGLRSMEAVRGRPSGLGQPMGPWPSGLASRMLGYEQGISRRDIRYSRRRTGPDLSAP